MKRLIIFVLALAAAVWTSGAQEKFSNGAEFDRTFHNFGDILLGSGPVSCTFELTNKGGKPIVIYNVTTTCGCTDVEWTREPLKPEAKGSIKVTYSNDEGPYPFDKSLTVYMSDMKKPIILKLRGVSIDRQKPLAELYPVRFGVLGMKEAALKCGNLEQGNSRTDAVLVANLSSKPVKVGFTDISEHLELSVSPNPIPAGKTAELRFTVTASRDTWGKNLYYATPLVDGKAASGRLSVWAFTKENFNHITEQQKMNAPMPRFETSTFNFGKAKIGEIIDATFTFKNEGRSDFWIYKLDTDACGYSHSAIPVAKPGETVTFRVHIETKSMKKGESLTIVTLTTNSPSRPIVNLFISGTLY